LEKLQMFNNTRLVSLYILTRQSIFDIFHPAAEAHTHASVKGVATGRPLRQLELFPTTPRWDTKPTS